jgi:hypothetical protein
MMTAVSPIAFPIPSITPVVMPGIALGSATRLTVCHFVAPSAKLASRRPPGTALSDSSETLTIHGSIMNMSASPPERIEKPNPRYIARNAYPKSPITIEGMPARHSTPNEMMRVTVPSGAYSARYIAAPMPIGTAESSVTSMRQNVPTIAGRMPPSAPLNLGDSSRNESVNTGSP